MTALVRALADAPSTILQTLADTMLEVFRCGSAGLSLLAKDGKTFYWPAIAGLWGPHAGGGTPRDHGPCGDVLDRNVPLLFTRFERRYPYLLDAPPAAEECLLVPFQVGGKTVGTVWAIAHDDRRVFDGEDLRLMESLARFAAAAYRAVESALEARRSQDAIQSLSGNLLSEARFRALFAHGPLAIYSCDAAGVIQEYNASAAAIWGREPRRGDPEERFCGSHKLYLPDGSPLPHDQTPVVAVLRGEVPFVRDAEVVMERPDGTRLTVVANIVPLNNDRGAITGAMNCFYDITDRKRGEMLLADQKAVLELAAAGAAMTDILQLVVDAAQRHSGEPSRASLFLLEPGGAHLRFAVAAGLDDAYTRAVDHFAVGPHMPSCGQVAHTGRPVVCGDVETDPLWEPFLGVVRAADIRAVWSQPLRTVAGKVLGTMALYYREPRVPGPGELDAVRILSQTAALVVERALEAERRGAAEEQLRLNRDTFYNLIQNSPFGLYVVDAEFRVQQVSTASQKIFEGVRPLLGRDFPEVLRLVWAEPFASEAIGRFRHTLATGEPYSAPNTTEARYGDVGVESYDWKIERVTLPDGQFGVVCYFYDITERMQAEVALRASQSRLRHAANAAGLTYVEVDLASGVARTAENFAAVMGYAPPGQEADATTGSRALLDRVVPDDRAGVRAALLEFTEGRRVGTIGYRVLGDDRVERFIESVWSIECDPNGVPLKSFATNLDVTDRKSAAEALRQSDRNLQFIMDSAPQKICTARPDGGIDYCNPQWLEYSGLTFAQLADWGWTGLVHPDDRAENVRVWQQSLESGEPYQFENRFRRADGEYRWHLNRATAMRDAAGKVSLWVGSNTDIHAQKQAAAELRESAADLAAADRRKNEFLAMLAHELRNPLAPIRNAVQVLRLTGGGGKAVAAADMMDRQVGQMVRLVDDLLDVSRIGQGKIELRRARVELAPSVNHAVEATHSLYQSMGHVVTVTLPPRPVFLNADATRLTQVVGNLLNNACKFTPKGGRVWLTVALDETGPAAAVEIRVRDTGVGIAADQLPRVFEMFTQIDSSLERSAGGLGIGLTLVKSLVEMHDGTVTVHSEGLGRGAEFVVRLPVAADPPEPPPDPAGGVPVPPTARRILVVDDNRDSADSMAMVLELTGNEIRTAYNGLEAVAAAEAFRPDVVLMDLGMPKLNGYEAARRIRDRGWGVGVVLVALSGWGQPDDREKSKAAGFDRHLVKPVSHAVLAALLAELLPTPPQPAARVECA